MAEEQPASKHGDSRVITLIGTMALKPEHEPEFVDVARRTAQTVHESEPGTILYVMHEHPTEPHAYVWVERYRDAEALKAHVEAPYIGEAMANLASWLSRPPELMQLNQMVPE